MQRSGGNSRDDGVDAGGAAGVGGVAYGAAENLLATAAHGIGLVGVVVVAEGGGFWGGG